MMSPHISRGRLLLAVSSVMTAFVVYAGLSSPSTAFLSQLSPEQREHLEEEAEEARQRRFDEPAEAIAFYANKRTGALLTRGPNPTLGVRPLSAAPYLAAAQQMRAMPRYSSATGTVLASIAADPTAAATPGAALGSWSPLGPSNQGGRTRALIIDPGNPNVMYAGGVGGGVWKTTDAGGNWTPVADLTMANLAVVSLAFDPSNTNTIYAGTGEGFFNADAIRGAGIFKSTDSGASWSQLASTNVANFHYVNSLAVSPRNTLRMFAATRTGLFRSTDGGANWTSLVSATAVNGCTQVTMQTAGASGFVFASCGNFAQGTVYRVPDDDVSTVTSVLSLTGQGRSSIAIAPSNQTVVYVMSAQATPGGGVGVDGLHGVYRSISNGDAGSFTTQMNGTVGTVTVNHTLLSNPVYAFASCVGSSLRGFFNQGWYDNVLAVDPLDSNRVWAGGIDLFRSDDGGANWGTAGYWWATKGDPTYHHADQHGIVFHPNYNGTTNKIMFSASDGGVERIDDARAPVNTTEAQICGTGPAATSPWIDRNNGYTTTQFYDGTVYPDGQGYFGGLQDNGTQRGDPNNTTWSILTGGDGGYTALDTKGNALASDDVLFVEYTGLSIQRSTNNGSNFSTVTSGISGDSGFAFITPFTMNQGNRQQLWIGGYYLWRTVNQATTWVRASAITPGNGSVSAIATHPLDGNRVVAAMSDGYILSNTAALTSNNLTAWPNTRPSTGYISSLAWDPNNLNVAYATVSSFGTTNLFKSTDGGASWVASVGSGLTALPQIPALSVVVNPDDSQQVYVGTDLGVFTSVDGGASWYVENTGFANVSVESLKMSETAPKKLYAFTHGRGAWRVTPGAGVTMPTASNDAYNTPFNTVLNVAAPGVLGNDITNGGGTMSAVLDTTTANGVLSLNTNGGFTFTPTTGFNGQTTFTYHVTNSNGSSNIATVTITVAAGAPTSVADSYNTPFNTALNVAAPGVLGNDNTNGGGTMTAAVQAGVAHGSLTLNGNGSFLYTPTTGYTGPDSFTYRATNTVGAGNTVTVSLTVNAGAPTAAADAYSTPFNTVLNVAAPGVLGNDNTNGGGAMTAAVQAGVAHGSLTLNANGSFTYTPTTGYAGPDSFTYRATNSQGPGNTVTVSLTVGTAAPTALADSYSTPFNTALNVAAPGVLGNDNTNGGGAMTAAVQAGVAHGSLTLNANGSFIYTPTTGYAGPDSFTYRATNSQGPGNTVTVSLTVNAAVPTAVGDSYSTPFNTVLNVATPGVLGNDTTNGGGAMNAVLQSNVAHGVLALNANGSFTYTPTTGYSGPDSFTYRASNGVGPSNVATVTITVGGAIVPPPPVGANDTFNATEGTVLNVAAPGVLGNDNANAGGLMTAVLQTTVAHGSLSLASDGSFSYTPTIGYVGADSFTYRPSTVNGGAGNVTTVSIAVAASTTPVAPGNFRVTGMAGNVLTFAWTLPTSGPAPTGMQLEGGLTPGSVLGTIPLGATPSATLALPSGSFYLRLRTLTANGPSVASNEILTHVDVPVAPSAPANLLGAVSGNVLALSWTPTFTGGQPTGAVLDVSGAVVASLPLGAVETFTYPTVPGGTYTFAVRQTGAGGSSTASTPITLSFPGSCTGTPQAPANFLAFKSGGVLYLSWDPPVSGPAATGYVLNVTGSFVGSLPMTTRTFAVPPPPGTFNLSVVPTNPCGAGTATPVRTVSFP